MLMSIHNLLSKNFNLDVKLVEPEVNNEASTYIIENYKDIVKNIKKYNVKDEKAADLLHDVYLSFVDSEAEGNGFNMTYGENKNGGGAMTVEQFVYGRIKKYALNEKYSTEVSEAVRGNILEFDGKKPVKVPTKFYTCAASSNETDDLDNNDSFQTGYSLASVADSTDEVAEILSCREQIDYCIDICSLHGINILNIFKNVDMLVSLLDTKTRKRSAESIFGRLTELVTDHDELAEAIQDILMLSQKNRGAFDLILASY